MCRLSGSQVFTPVVIRDSTLTVKTLCKARLVFQVQPGNRQAQDLEAVVKKKMEREGLIGMAVVGGATLFFGAAVGLGIALAKRH